MAETRTARRRREAQEAKAQERGNAGDGLRRGVDAAGDAVRGHPGVLISLAIALFVVAMLYGPARNYYVAWRSGQDLQAYYAAISEQNESLMQDLGRLTSQEGIEDEAHRRGYVKDDETGVVVEGLPQEDLSKLLGEIQLEDTRPWYIKALDVVFFYRKDSWQ